MTSIQYAEGVIGFIKAKTACLALSFLINSTTHVCCSYLEVDEGDQIKLKALDGILNSDKKIAYFLIALFIGACTTQPYPKADSISPITAQAIQEVTEFNHKVLRLTELIPLCIADFKTRSYASGPWFLKNCQEMNSLLSNITIQRMETFDSAQRIVDYAQEYLQQGQLPPASLERLINDFDYSRNKSEVFSENIRMKMGACYFDFAIAKKYMFFNQDCCTEYETYGVEYLTKMCKSNLGNQLLKIP